MPRTLLAIHRWIGIVASLYLVAVCTSGAALVFRIELQRTLHPDLLTSSGIAPMVSMASILARLEAEYPERRVFGIDAPTTSRDTYLAYVADEHGVKSVLIDPTSAAVLGELPQQTVVRMLQELHFNLFAGRIGRTVNGVGALCLLCLSMTGPLIWWRGSATPGRIAAGAMRESWPYTARGLHRTIGICAALMLALLSMTALSFTFPRQFRAMVSAAFPLKSVTPPSSAPTRVAQPSAPSWSSMIVTAEALEPDKYVARVVMPRREHDTLQVLFAAERPTPAGSVAFDTVHIDRQSGAVVFRSASGASPGDAILAWVASVHFGSFGGIPIKLLWVLTGLAPLALVVTGVVSWWTHRQTLARH